MGFLAPWFLVGLLAIGLPFWLHLLKQFKRTPQPFSSLMFFERRVQSSVKHRRLRYLTLLSLRVLLLVLLALAFASPFVNRKSESMDRRTLTIIAVDRSFSMRAGNRMQQAKEAALSQIDAIPSQGLGQIIAVDSGIENLTQAVRDRATLRAAVNTISANDQASSFGEFARALRYIEQTSGMRLMVHLIGDMQQTSMPADFHALRTGPYISLQLSRVGGGSSANWAVETVVAPASIDPTSERRISATIAGWDTPQAVRRVTMLLDGKELLTKEVTIPANGRAQVEFNGFDVPYGSHRGEIQIAPNDSLPQDDHFGFALERSDVRKALFLNAKNRGTGSFFYQTALESGTHGSITAQVTAANETELRDFSRFAFVVLNDPGDLEPGLADALCRYVQKGGSVLIGLGPNTARSGVIPLSKEQFSIQRTRQSAGYLDKAHAALAAAGDFENVQFSDTASFAPKSDARVLAKFSDGSPLLIEERAGEGRKLIFASTFDDSTNDFALHSSFVPFVVQTARYLAGLEDKTASSVVGSAITLRQRSNDGAAEIIGPDGRRALSLAEASKALSFVFERSGFYEVSRADGRHTLLAVHPDLRESDLRPVSDETLNLWRNTGETGGRAEKVSLQTQEQPWSFWRYFLAAALVAALLESIFASRYLKEGAQPI